MKLKNVIVLIGFLFSTVLLAQNQQPQTHFIEVTGSAEMSFDPDEVTFSIGIQGTDKKTLQDAEEKFFAVLKKHKIELNEVDFKSSNNYGYNWWNSRNTFRKLFNIKINPKVQVLSFMEDLNEKWVSQVNLIKKDHSNIAEYRKETKIKAMKAAKEKADYLLNSIGNKTGKPLEIVEIENSNISDIINIGYLTPSYANVKMKSENNDDSINNVDKIKLRYEIRAKFEIL